MNRLRLDGQRLNVLDHRWDSRGRNILMFFDQ